MKKTFLISVSILAAGLFYTTNVQAQSLKDLLKRENVEKVVSAVTGKNTASMEGTWNYTGAAVEFESDNLLAKAGGTVAANTVEEKLNEQLAKVGFEEGKLSFTFNADSTFMARISGKDLKGTYSYDTSHQKVNLKFAKLVGLNAKLNCTSTDMNLLFNFDKLLDLITFLSSKSNNNTLQTVGSLAEGYDGMLMGFSLKKE